MEETNKKTLNILFWIFVICILFIPVFLVGEELGLYYDSINPDYTAVQLVFPSEHVENYCFSFPYLTQVYHGTVSMWITAVAVFLMGKTSCLQHNLINAIEIFLCIVIVDQILKRKQVKRWIRVVIVLLCATMPTLFSACLIQYYVAFPGMVFSLLMTLILESAKKKEEKKRIITEFFGFCCGGFAFYCYFNYLFFFPGVLFLQVINEKNNRERIKQIITACCGLLSGCSLYFAGFVQYLRGSHGESVNDVVIPIAASLIVIAGCVILLSELLKNKLKATVLTAIGMGTLGGIGFCYYFRGSLSNLLGTAQNVLQNNANVSSAWLWQLWENLSGAVTGSTAEKLISWSRINTSVSIYLYIFAIITAGYLLHLLGAKKVSKPRAWQYLLVIMIYLFCCFPIVRRMQTQHFIPLVFWFALLLGLEIDELSKAICWLNKPAIKAVITAGCILLVGFGMNQKTTIVNWISENGGRGYYTNQVNVLAAEALETKNEGVNEVYIFPGWGFMTEFNYLTCNQVEWSSHAEVDNIKEYLNRGYEVVIPLWAWNDENVQETMVQYTAIENTEANIDEYYEKGGNLSFYKITLRAQ